MDDQLKALDRVTSMATDLAMKFGPRLPVAIINQAILDSFRSRNIAFPVPQHEVRMLPV